MKKRLLIFLFSLSIINAKAQNWGGGIDQEDFNWGFGFQYVASEFKIIRNVNWRTPFNNQDPLQGKTGDITDSLKSISSLLSPGFGVGFVLNYKVTPHLDVRSTPSLVFNDRIVDYVYDEPSLVNNNFSEKQQKIQSTMVDFPLTLKLKSDRRRDFRAYMLVGLKYSMDLVSKEKSKDEDYALIDKLLKNKKNYSSYEFGLGFDFYFEFFKMSPEIKVSHSFKDVLKRENHPYATPIDKAILRNFTFSLFFE
jgi:hypothetical protein